MNTFASFDDVWNAVRDYCRDNLNGSVYSMWIMNIVSAQMINDKIVLSTSSDFESRIIATSCLPDLKEAFLQAAGIENFNIVIQGPTWSSDGQVRSSEEPETETRKEEAVQQDELTEDVKTSEADETDNVSRETSSKYRFDNFIVGASNQVAYASSYAVATSQPGTKYNPLFIYGGSGLGKTHLLFAIRHEMKHLNPNLVILYTTLNNFVNDYITTIKNKSGEDFRDKYRNVDVLILDDIQFIKKNTGTQDELFHTFNDLVSTSKQIIITSDRPPKELDGLPDRLKSRFVSGLLAQIAPPDIETRIAIIRQNADEKGVKLTESQQTFIAEKIRDNVRELEGAINKLQVLQSMDDAPLTMKRLREVIKDIETENKPVASTSDDIIEDVADMYDLSKDDLKSDKRKANITQARNIAMYVIKEVTNLSYEAIGDMFGGRKHSTVINSINNVEQRIRLDQAFKTKIYNLIKEHTNVN